MSLEKSTHCGEKHFQFLTLLLQLKLLETIAFF